MPWIKTWGSRQIQVLDQLEQTQERTICCFEAAEEKNEGGGMGGG